jgi:methylated-DNA-[protein]-cysteine S-methyltransferase
MSRLVVESPFGPLTLSAEAGALTALSWGDHGSAAPGPELAEAAAQLEAYFAGRRTAFDLPLALRGSAMQQAVLRALQAIPYGETRRYGDLAADLGLPAQAVGQACGANPLPILIPCHRVLAANGLGGYSGAGGIETKVALLRREGAAGLLI